MTLGDTPRMLAFFLELEDRKLIKEHAKQYIYLGDIIINYRNRRSEINYKISKGKSNRTKIKQCL